MPKFSQRVGYVTFTIFLAFSLLQCSAQFPNKTSEILTNKTESTPLNATTKLSTNFTLENDTVDDEPEKCMTRNGYYIPQYKTAFSHSDCSVYYCEVPGENGTIFKYSCRELRSNMTKRDNQPIVINPDDYRLHIVNCKQWDCFSWFRRVIDRFLNPRGGSY